MDNTDEEVVAELTAVVNQYPDELDGAMVSELTNKVEQYAADNVLLEKAYLDLERDSIEYAEAITAATEEGMQSAAKAAYDDISFAQNLLAE